MGGVPGAVFMGGRALPDFVIVPAGGDGPPEHSSEVRVEPPNAAGGGTSALWVCLDAMATGHELPSAIRCGTETGRAGATDLAKDRFVLPFDARRVPLQERGGLPQRVGRML